MKVVPDGNDATPVITGWPCRESTSAAANNESSAINAKEIANCLSEVELKSPSPVAFNQQHPNASAFPASESAAAMNAASHAQQQAAMHQLMLQHGQLNGSAGFAGHQQMSQEQMNMMAMQFMNAMQRSVNQVANQPHFGFEWVKPDFQFDPSVTFGNMDADVAVSSDSASSSDTSSNFQFAANQPVNGLHKSPTDASKFPQEPVCQNGAEKALDEYGDVMKDYGTARVTGSNGHIFGH